MNSWNEYANMTKEELENLKIASLRCAINTYNDMLVKGDIESFEKAHETLENMIPKPKFDIHLDD